MHCSSSFSKTLDHFREETLRAILKLFLGTHCPTSPVLLFISCCSSLSAKCSLIRLMWRKNTELNIIFLEFVFQYNAVWYGPVNKHCILNTSSSTLYSKYCFYTSRTHFFNWNHKNIILKNPEVKWILCFSLKY